MIALGVSTFYHIFEHLAIIWNQLVKNSYLNDTLYFRNSEESAGFTASVFNTFNRFNAGQQRKAQVSIPASVGFSWGSRDSGLSNTSVFTSQGFDNPIYGTMPTEVLATYL